jgi:hypothetical protein
MQIKTSSFFRNLLAAEKFTKPLQKKEYRNKEIIWGANAVEEKNCKLY